MPYWLSHPSASVWDLIWHMLWGQNRRKGWGGGQASFLLYFKNALYFWARNLTISHLTRVSYLYTSYFPPFSPFETLDAVERGYWLRDYLLLEGGPQAFILDAFFPSQSSTVTPHFIVLCCALQIVHFSTDWRFVATRC